MAEVSATSIGGSRRALACPHIEDGLEFAHCCDEGETGGFAGLAQTAVEAFEHRVVLDGDQTRHVERRPAIEVRHGRSGRDTRYDSDLRRMRVQAEQCGGVYRISGIEPLGEYSGWREWVGISRL
jgi:hypothetical protein